MNTVYVFPFVRRFSPTFMKKSYFDAAAHSAGPPRQAVVNIQAHDSRVAQFLSQRRVLNASVLALLGARHVGRAAAARGNFTETARAAESHATQ